MAAKRTDAPSTDLRRHHHQRLHHAGRSELGGHLKSAELATMKFGWSALPWFQTWRHKWRQQRENARVERRRIPDDLWRLTVQRYPFVSARPHEELLRLRRLTSLFLSDKEFSGAGGMQVNDEVAVAVALQACLPILNLGLSRYDGFKGIVIHADEVLAQRSEIDEDGVVHEYAEALTGEAMQGGPVTLSWSDVADAGETAALAYNVVIHEFAHVLDMHSHASQTHLSTPELRRAHQDWNDVLLQEFQSFVCAVESGAETVLDPYGAESPQEFFAVASEAFFVQPDEMRRAQAALYGLMRQYYQQDPAASTSALVGH